MRNFLVIAIVVLGACGKKESADKTETKPADPPKPTEPAPKPTEPAAKPTAVTLPIGDAKFGCVAWSAKAKTALCVTGERGPSIAEMNISFVGAEPLTNKIDTQIDKIAADAANDVLAKGAYTALTDAPTAVPQGTATDAGGVTITWTLKETKKGGDNIAPTSEGKVVAKCGGKDVDIFTQPADEGRSFGVAVRKLTGTTIVEITTHLGREGEYADGLEAITIDTASCAVDSSAS